MGERKTDFVLLLVCIAAGQLIHETSAAPALLVNSSDTARGHNEVGTKLDALQQQLAEIRANMGQSESVAVVGDDVVGGENTGMAEVTRVESVFPPFYATLDKASQQPIAPPPPPRRRQYRRHLAWQPMRRMVSWQPMKRAQNVEYSREQVVRAIEDQLSEVLSAGERLGISADDIVNHLRERGSAPNGGGVYYNY